MFVIPRLIYKRNNKAGFTTLDPVLERAMLDEEVMEFQEAIDRKDDVEVLDWYCDILFVATWTMFKYWFSVWQLVFGMLEVIRSNNSKMPFIRDENWKIKKWPNFTKPRLHKII